jgi:peptidoglycan/xylan/chitin deacetylase (PgdA/CDA1 family)
MRRPVFSREWRPILTRQPQGVSDVALTFDDGPSPRTTPQILRELDQAGAKATFFYTGVRLAANPSLAAETVACGHEVFAHGWDHVSVNRATVMETLGVLRRVEDLLTRFRPPPDTYLVRFPYNSGIDRLSVHRAAARFHRDPRFTSWSSSPRDWTLADGCADLSALRRRCAVAAAGWAADKALAGAIVLLHEDPFDTGNPQAHRVSAILLPMILDYLRGKQLTAGLIRTEPLGRKKLNWIPFEPRRFCRESLIEIRRAASQLATGPR